MIFLIYALLSSFGFTSRVDKSSSLRDVKPAVCCVLTSSHSRQGNSGTVTSFSSLPEGTRRVEGWKLPASSVLHPPPSSTVLHHPPSSTILHPPPSSVLLHPPPSSTTRQRCSLGVCCCPHVWVCWRKMLQRKLNLFWIKFSCRRPSDSCQSNKLL